MADVFDFQTGRRRPISVKEYLALLDTMIKYFKDARKQRGNGAFRQSEELLKEIRFIALFNLKFREETRDELKVILDDVYADILEHE